MTSRTGIVISGISTVISLEESDLPEDAVYQHNTIKQTFLGRKLLFSGKSFADAVAARRDIMQKAKDGDLLSSGMMSCTKTPPPK